MAKEKLPEVVKLHRKEEKSATPTNERSKPKAVSVYLSNKDKHTLDEIALENNINRHMLLSYCVRYFLANYRAGHIKLDPTIEAGKVVLNVHIDLDKGALDS
jgi:predicted transcriptional regulator